jgi:hypothetical protein
MIGPMFQADTGCLMAKLVPNDESSKRYEDRKIYEMQ